jgi:outer membrane receptor protein involved in Fe transport
MRLPWSITLLLASAPLPVVGQTTTGSLAGTVLDESGSALAGVSVSLAGELVTTTSVQTDPLGRYRFLSLPPGGYTLAFSLAGFATLTRSGLRVRLGASQELDVVLSRSAREESVTVTAEGPLVDARTTKVGARFDADWVRNAPGRRVSFFDLINAAPGVSADSTTSTRSSSLGANTDENTYLLDGTDFTDTVSGAAWPWPNVDAIGEVEIVTLGAPAEYGNVQGAVFNVITRQGTNAFHGDVNFYFQDQGLTGRNTSPQEDGGLPYHRDGYRDLTLQLSGPVLSDRLFFFASYEHLRDRDSRSGTDPLFPKLFEEDRLFLKLTWHIGPRNRLQLAYHDERPYRLSDQGGANIAASARWVQHGTVPTPNLTFTRTWSNRSVVELRYAGFYGRDHLDPLDGGPRKQARFYDFDTGQISGGVSGWWDSRIWRTSLSGKLSHHADEFLGGEHDFRFGVQHYAGGWESTEGTNAYIYTYSYEGATRNYGTTRDPFVYGVDMRSTGLYADDSVRLGSRLTLNAGLRYDHSRAFYPAFPILDASGKETGVSSPANDRLFLWDTLSPRLGVSLKLTSDAKTVLRAHYGRYHRGIVTGEFDQLVPSLSPVYSGSWDFAAAGFDPDSLVLADAARRHVDPAFRGPYTDQFLLAAERELAPNLAIALQATHKRGTGYGRWKDIGGRYESTVYIDDRGADATGRPIPVVRLLNDPREREFLLTNADDMFTSFDGVVFQIIKRMAGGWQLSSSLTLGRAKGRVGSSNQFAGSNQSGTANDFGQNPNDLVNTDQGLIGDRTRAIKAQLLARLPAGLLLAANYSYATGKPWARMAIVGELGLFTRILAEPLDGRRRLPSWNLFDLRLQKGFGLRGRVELALFADLLNAFNDDAYEWVESQFGGAENFGRPAGYIAPRRAMLGAKLTF